MGFLKQCSGLRAVFLSVSSLLCVLLASAVTESGPSNGLLRKKPSVVLQASRTLITLPCPESFGSISQSCPSTLDLQVPLTAIADGFNKQARYVYTVTGGRIVGEGSKVTWDLSGVGPGYYNASVEAQDNRKQSARSSLMLTIANCGDCGDDRMCPTLVVDCYDQVKTGTLAVCAVRMRPSSNVATYEWSVNASGGEDLSGKIKSHGSSVSIPTEGLADQTVYVKVNVKGLDPSCSGIASGATVVKP